MTKKKICVTGATGTMGMATMKELSQRLDRFEVVAFARRSKKNQKKLAPFLAMGMEVVWGNLLNLADVKQAVGDADYILHMGGMVSPAADYYPEQTLKVNVEGARNVAQAVMEGQKPDTAKVVYIGSVAQSGDHRPPTHWGRTGEPLIPSKGDAYAVSKVLAELAIVDSGLKHWVCLRQTGILYPGLIFKGSDPITFHVPLRGVLEWVTDEQSGRLMANICEANVPESFWNKFYNIGGGESYRLTNYEFEKLLMKALHCPPPHKCFGIDWFATDNFHGQWWQDSDRLEEIVPFRGSETADEYFQRLAKMVPWYFKLAPLAPAPLVKWGMKFVANKKPLGTLYWLKNNITEKINAHFGSKEAWKSIAGWEEQMPQLENYPQREPRGSRIPPKQTLLSHGYDESKLEAELTIADMRQKAEFQGGKCLSAEMMPGDLTTHLQWKCSCGHEFEASPMAVLKGGHWCTKCLKRQL